jgi:hypothetical protein
MPNDLILRSGLPPPHDSIRVPAGESFPLEIKTTRNTSIVFTVVDAINGRRVEINGKPMKILKPTETVIQQETLYFPARGMGTNTFGKLYITFPR